jgi:hypothetical protein
MSKDWNGDYHSVFGCLGASNLSKSEREINDYYATDPVAGEWLIKLEDLCPNIWECACGEGHLSKVFIKHGFKVRSTDLIDRGFGEGGIDFLKCNKKFDGDIVTNPPYKYAQEFIEHALSLVPNGNKVCMFLKIQFLEGKSRRLLYELYPPRTIWVSSSRLACLKNGKEAANAIQAYGWYVWEKGYKGDTTVKWFN